MNKFSNESANTYSATMRELHSSSPEKVKPFMKAFKNAFDDALENNIDNHQYVALMAAKKAHVSVRFNKLAQAAISSGGSNPNEVGRIVADIIKVLLARVPHDKSSVYRIMKDKILNINVVDISNKKLPDTATYGQAITLIKTLLSGYNSEFVKQVLINAANYLYAS